MLLVWTKAFTDLIAKGYGGTYLAPPHIFAINLLNHTCPRHPWLHREHSSPYLVGTHRTLTSPWNSPSRPRIMYVTRRKYHYPNSDFMAIRPHHRSVSYLCWSLSVKTGLRARIFVAPSERIWTGMLLILISRFVGAFALLPCLWGQKLAVPTMDFWKFLKFFWVIFLRVQNENN